jgi:exodeoxyribonuclease VII large subunit
VSPLATLERGYAIVSNERGEILRDAARATPGTLIEARLASGRVRAEVTESSVDLSRVDESKAADS